MRAVTPLGLLSAAALFSSLCVAGCELDDECDPDAGEICEPTGSVTDAGHDGTTDQEVVDEPTGYRYVYVVDVGSRLGPPHPGADIDAVEVVVNGTSYYGTAITDRQQGEPDNRADDPNQALGPPGPGGNGAAECDVDADPEHWYSLGGGWIIVDMGEDNLIESGSELIVYECGASSGGNTDPYGVSIGVSSRLDQGPQFFPVTTEAAGVLTTTITF